MDKDKFGDITINKDGDWGTIPSWAGQQSGLEKFLREWKSGLTGETRRFPCCLHSYVHIALQFSYFSEVSFNFDSKVMLISESEFGRFPFYVCSEVV